MNTNRPIDELFARFGVRDALDLSRYVSRIDQQLWKSNTWDYKNKNILNNEIVRILETIDRSNFSYEEEVWIDEIIWFWYHHAISCAISRYKDKDAAQRYAQIAVEYQNRHPDHPNKITWLLYLIVNDRYEEAKTWVNSIPSDHPEKITAAETLDECLETSPFV